MITDAIRRIMQPIANLEFTIPIGFGKTIGFKARTVLPQGFLDFVDEKGSVGKELLNFVDKSGSVTPSTTPSRPAASVTPTTAGEAGRGGSPIIINQSTQSNTRQGDQFSLSKGITDNSFGAQIANTFAQ